MPVRRILYLAFLAASFFYYVFHTGYVSWILLIVAVALPILSILITWLLARGAHRVEVCCNTARTDVQRGFTISLRLHSSFPSVQARVRLVMENLFTGETIVQKPTLSPEEEVAVSYEEERCGLIRISAKSPRIMDLLGLIGIPIPADAPVEVLLLPGETVFSGNPDALFPQGSGERQRVEAGISPTREWKDIRDYREGDQLRDIHWKLTARRGRAVVREYEWAADKAAVVAVLCGETPEEAGEAVARFLGVARSFLEAGFSLGVLWPAYIGGEVQTNRYFVEDAGQLDGMLRQAMRRQCYGNSAGMKRQLTHVELLQNHDWLLVSPQSASLCSGAAGKEEPA